MKHSHRLTSQKYEEKQSLKKRWAQKVTKQRERK